MPEFKIPVGSSLIDSDASSVDIDDSKTELSSLRSSSPKSSSLSTASSSCSSSTADDSRSNGSDRSAAAAALSEEIDETTAAAVTCGLEDDLEASLHLCEEDRAEELMRQGADMRHVLCTSWRLQPKMAVGMRLRKGSSTAAGSGGGKALRDAALAQKKAIIQVTFFFYTCIIFLYLSLTSVLVPV
jgi:hypothetical protein